MVRSLRTAAPTLAIAVAIGLWAARAPGIDVAEVEPNDTKLVATTAVLAPGDTLSGMTTGTSTTSPGQASADYFRVRTTAQPPAIYRRQLTLTSSPSGHTVTVRGHSQSGGLINAASDVAVQTGSTATVPARTVAWYGFGREETIFFRVTGSASTTGPYSVAYSTSTVTPVIASGTLFEGPVTIAAAAGDGSTIDPDTWLYDATLTAIPAAGNDDISGSPTAGPSSFTRVLGPGVYTLAVAPYQFMNDQPSPPDDDWRSGNVLDFPDAALASTVGAAGSAQIGLVNVTISDGINPPVVSSVSFTPGRIGEVQFVQFTIVADPNSTGACCLNDGSCQVRTQARCLLAAGLYQGDLTTCPITVCPPIGACCDAGGCCAVTFAADCSTGAWLSGTLCTPNLCLPPVNDTCASAITLEPGAAFIGSNCNAQNSGDGPAASCQGTAGRGVWFTFTPASSGLFSISACGSPHDTVLQVFTTVDCVNFVPVACDDDACDGVTPPGSSLASVISSVPLTAGVTYRIRLSSFGVAPAGGGYTLVVNPVLPTGSCCVSSCCTVTTQPACAGAWVEAAGCTPNPCAAPVNDSCSAAAPLALGVAVSGGTCNATSAGDGPAATCQGTSGKGVWFTFVPTHEAAYRISSCGSAHDTVVQVFTSPDCLIFNPVACDDDACDGITPPGSANASVIASASLAAGVNYLIRLSSFGSAPAGGSFTLAVTSVGPLGNCCTNGACTLTDAAACPSPGVFTAAGVCDPSPCAPATGACCCGSTCTLTTPAACAGPNQHFVGAGAACNLGGNSTAPCCIADFNQSGSVSVQDIFDFLGAYFAGDPCSDISASGPPPSVQDIFDFLAVYFAGCG